MIEIYPDGYFEDVDRGAGVRTLHYPDGDIRVRHLCKVIDGAEIYVAPALQLDAGHKVVATIPLTVTPSILCPDCGLHGFLTDGRWVS